MTRNTRQPAAAATVLLALGALLAACGDGDDAEKKGATGASSSPPHGYVEGAEEAAEQQSRLVMADDTTGAVRMLDLISGKTTKLGAAKDTEELITDGRFGYARSATGTRIFDSGSWMVDHGDHIHYYRAKPRDTGTLPGAEPEHVHSGKALTAVTSADGKAVLLDRGELEDGKLRRAAEIDGVRGPVVPYETYVLVPTAGKTTVEVRDRKGGRVHTLPEKCAELRGAAVTRSGVVYGCADGALLVTEKSGKLSAEKIEYAEPVAASDRPDSFRHRSQSATLTAKAGEKGIRVLDVSERKWQWIDSGKVTAVNTAGEGAPVLALTTAGFLKAYDAETGKETASRKLIASPPDGEHAPAPVIEVDGSRAYVNDPAAKKVYEIDYNDGLRTARSFSLDFTPAHMVETGR
ncbi:hypothetical protein DVA86_06995 [Streptomyces armeniacus]|uniref:Lipoprotein n=1 Tax=Streptomyces armeniacus TaxID=83291 RepID=A0A345XLC2_9ACTN|nr:hypothetical protein [Streptomyces armeniacus]AXK32438.1 hypothetical protein DVA86_06995 [Streptomyces armeniacus]